MIVYASRTGNVEYIVGKLGLPSRKIEGSMQVEEDYILFTYTDRLGEVPEVVKAFLEDNASYCKGVIASGNWNFGTNFGKAGDIISTQLGVPLIAKVDLRGEPRDYEKIKKSYEVTMWKSI